MRSASRRADDALRARQEELIGTASTADLTALAGELHQVGSLIAGQPRLRRLLGDPATSSEKRSDLAASLLRGKVSDTALQIVLAAVTERWSSPWDMSDAIENAGDAALFAAAEKDGSLDRIEDELFRLERILQSEGELTSLLDEQVVEVGRRTALLDSLVADKVSPITLALLRQAIASERKRSIELAVDDLLEQAAARQERSIARVMSAVPLSDAQQERLAGTLTTMYGRPMSLRVALDPTLRGGLVVRVGDEVIDGSIATRFAHAKTALGA